MTKTNSELDEILDWQVRAVTEAMVKTEITGKPVKVHVTQELIDRHKSKAKQAIQALIDKKRSRVIFLA